MREIKFRAWDGEDMFLVDTLEFPVGGTRWFGPGVGKGICAVNTQCDWKVDSFLMQYTNLKDKNGVEIYEGDIIKSPGSHPLEVYWMGLAFGICWNDNGNKEESIICPDGMDMDIDDNGKLQYIEIIGNIYQNPELLNAT